MAQQELEAKRKENRQHSSKSIFTSKLVWSNPLRVVGFIANGMTPSELKGRLEMEIQSWEMVGKG